MDKQLKEIYVREVMAQGQFSLNAIHSLNNAMQNLQPNKDMDKHRLFVSEVFRSIHSFLTHASNISRILWPPHVKGVRGRERLERGNEIREILEINDNSILKDRSIRDHLEHFDERLDNWRASSKRHNFAQDNIGPWGSIGGIEDSDVMRWYDPEDKCFLFRGERYYLQESATAVDELIRKCSQQINGT